MRCPNGHESATDDYCDVCGARLSVVPAAASFAEAPPDPPCPHCGVAPMGPGRFCENCGYDTNTGRVPTLSPAPAPVAEWTATITADQQWFDENSVEGVPVEFPAGSPAREVRLTPPQIRIGRKSATKGTDPEWDLADDPGVSHSHALLTQHVDGRWLVSDMGSTNGTYLNDEPEPLPPGRSRPLTGGDRLHLGAWTLITFHAP